LGQARPACGIVAGYNLKLDILLAGIGKYRQKSCIS